MIEVRIRHYDDASGVHLCTWPSTELDSLIPTIKAWGVVIKGDTESDDFIGQIVVDGDGAYFEIVVGDDD